MLEFRSIAGGYARHNIIEDISLTLPDGQLTVIIGPNGSGKSTLLKLGAGLLVPSQGAVYADGANLQELSPQNIAQKIAFMPQSRPLPDMTVETLVMHGRFPWLAYPRVYRAKDIYRAETAMQQAGIIGKRGQMLAKISGGERQKAYLAMALAQDTPHILLDEPSANLDIAVKMELEALLQNLKAAGKCVAVVLHDLAAALEMGDFVAVIKEGGLLATGTPAQILAAGAIEEAFNVRITRSEQIRFTQTIV
ncbi:MAG: ABC transporter ATP-binding protein [Lachnospiraceae bacterium]|jgi:iron complex transport system ATP-binding protein|nr:ABC transporter ATP-binding protein [Lachnospiraceae bacterium]